MFKIPDELSQAMSQATKNDKEYKERIELLLRTILQELYSIDYQLEEIKKR